MADATLTPTEEQQATTAAKQATTTSATEAIWTVGRRKSAVARVKMTQGSGDITVNDRPLEEYATAALAKARALAPLAVSDRLDSFDISIKVAGGGKLTQLDAISLGIARALLVYDETLRPQLKQARLLTRDARVKERKKYGLKRARKAPQFSKR